MLKKVHNQIDYTSNILLFGSCFSENITKKLEYYKFQNFSNPFGILFHPLAIENLVTNAINNKEYSENDIFFHNERWHCFDFHSELSNSSKDEFLKKLNKTINLTNQQLHNSTHIIITLGTSWVYRHIESDKIVANCHKISQKKFLKELLSADEVIKSLESIILLVKTINPKIEFIFTVSPVRHIKDGFVENSISKAHLITAINEIIDPKKHIHYFPSYEIMMDDLRDYRFYNSDMIHPNETAINYIWNQFKYTWIHQDSNKIMEQVENIQRGLAHKPFNPDSNQHQIFKNNLKLRINTLKEHYNIIF